MAAHDHARRVTAVPAGQTDRLRVRQRRYFLMMGVCIGLIVLAWNVVRFWSIAAAVAMSAVAAVIPPIAAVLANWDEDH